VETRMVQEVITALASIEEDSDDYV
jgi:hypothetical protein